MLLECYTYDVNSPDNDIDTINGVSSAAACQELCNGNIKCKYFLYGSTVSSGKCWLKSKRIPTLKKQEGLIFGPKICYGIKFDTIIFQ